MTKEKKIDRPSAMPNCDICEKEKCERCKPDAPCYHATSECKDQDHLHCHGHQEEEEKEPPYPNDRCRACHVWPSRGEKHQLGCHYSPTKSPTAEAPDTMRIDRDKEIDVRQAKEIVKDAVGANFLYPKMYDVLGRIPYHNLLIGIAEALRAARVEGAEAVMMELDQHECSGATCEPVSDCEDGLRAGGWNACVAAMKAKKDEML